MPFPAPYARGDLLSSGALRIGWEARGFGTGGRSRWEEEVASLVVASRGVDVFDFLAGGEFGEDAFSGLESFEDLGLVADCGS